MMLMYSKLWVYSNKIIGNIQNIIQRMLIGTPKHSFQQSQTQTYLNTFDLYIQSIRLEYKGYFYLQWKRGKKSIQTLKYQSQGSNKIAVLKQTLTLNITLSYKNGRVVQKNSILILYTGDGTIGQQVTIPIHRWLPEYSAVQIPIMHGILKCKVRRRQLMQIKLPLSVSPNQMQTYVPNSDDDEYSEMLEESINTHLIMSQTKQSFPFMANTQNTEQTKLRKQLQDTLYINNKLKNDRSILLTRTLQLQSQLSYLKSQLKQQIQILQKHTKNRIQLRQHIYQDQINSFVIASNRNSQWNRKVMQSLVVQRQQVQEQLMLVRGANEKLKADIDGYVWQVQELEKQKNALLTNIQQLTKQHQLQKQSLTQKLQLATKTLTSQSTLQSTLSITQAQLRTLQSTLTTTLSQLNSLQLQYTTLQSYNTQLQQQLQQNKNQLQFTQQIYKKLKEQTQIKEEQFRVGLGRLEEVVRMWEIRGREWVEKEGRMMDEIRDREQREIRDRIERERMEREKEDRYSKQQVYVRDNQALKKQIMRLRGQLQQQHYQSQQSQKSLQQTITTHLHTISTLTHKLQSRPQHTQIPTSPSPQLHKLSQQLQISQSLCVKYKQGMQRLQKQVVELRDGNMKLREQLQFINENGIKVEEHDVVVNRVHQLQAKLAEYQLHYQNVEFPSFQKQIGDSQSKKPKVPDYNNISFQSKPTQPQLTTLKQLIQSQTQTIATLNSQIESLTKHIQQLQLKHKQLQKQLQQRTKQIKIVEYCQSQDQQYDRVEEERDKLVSSNRSASRSGSHGARRKGYRDGDGEAMGEHRLRKTVSEKVEVGKRSRKEKQEEESRIVVQEQSKQQISIAEHDNRKEQPHLPQAKLISFRNNPKPTESPQMLKGSQKTKKSSIIQKISQPNIQQHFSQAQQQLQNKSRSSFISGTTLYKFQRVTHRQKIKHLQHELQQYKQYIQISKQRQNSLISQIQISNTKLEELQKELRVLEDDRHTLKASLHFELQKKNVVKDSKYVQVEQIEKYSRGVMVDLGKDELEREKGEFRKEIQRLGKVVDDVREQSKNRVSQMESKCAIFNSRVEEAQRRVEQANRRVQQKLQQIERLKKQLKQSQQQTQQQKSLVQTKTLQKQHIQFQIQKLLTSQKSLKQSIQFLQQKLKKQDSRSEALQSLTLQFKQSQYELQTTSKKLLQQNRTIYQLKLEKDTIEDEMKLVRKKNNDLSKKCSEYEYQIEGLEKSVEEAKRKEAKSKREIEDREDGIEKLRDQVKRLGEEIGMLKSLNNQQAFERKKYMQEINSLQHTIQRKQYEHLSSKKQHERLSQKLIQKQQQKQSQKSVYQKSLNTLQSQLSQYHKSQQQNQSTIRSLQSKLQQQQSDNKKNISQKSSLYSDKLKVYVEEIAEIKRLLEENNVENGVLRGMVKEREDQEEMLRKDIGRMEERIGEEVEASRKLAQMLQNQRMLSQKLNQKAVQLQQQLYTVRTHLKQLRLQHESLTKSHSSLQQSHSTLSHTHTATLQSLTRTKQSLSQLQSQYNTLHSQNEQLQQNDKKLQNMQKMYNQLYAQFQQYKGKYTKTDSEVQEMGRVREEKVKGKYEVLIRKGYEQQEKERERVRKYVEGETGSLMAQLEGLRADGQRKVEMINQLQVKAAKMQGLLYRISELQSQISQKSSQLQTLTHTQSTNTTLSQKLHSLTQLQSQSQHTIQQLQKQNQSLKHTTANLNISVQTLTNKYMVLQNECNEGKVELGNKEKEKSMLKAEVERLIERGRLLEEERLGLMEKMEDLRKDYNSKISKLEVKLEEMVGAVGQHQQTIMQTYQKSLQQLRTELTQTSQQLSQKQSQLYTQQQLTQTLTYELQQYNRQLTHIKQKQAQNVQLFEQEYKRMKQKMNEKQKQYKKNVSSMEMEIQEMSKEITSLRLKAMHGGRMEGSRGMEDGWGIGNMGGSGVGRLEDKLRQKDTKIEQLKSTIFLLQQSLSKYKSKQNNYIQQSQKLQSLQSTHSALLTTYNTLLNTHKQLQSSSSASQLSLKQQLLSTKSNIQKYRIQLQEKQMELQTMMLQLNTIKGLYGQLQKEMEKRMSGVRDKYQSERVREQELEDAKREIGEAERKLKEVQDEFTRMQQQLNKKNQYIETLQTKISLLTQTQNKLKTTTKQTTEGQQHYKQQITRLSQQNQLLTKQNKKLREQLTLSEKQHYETKTKLSLNQSSIDSLSMTVQEQLTKIRELESVSKKYNDLNEACFSIFRVGVEEGVFRGWFSRKMGDLEGEIKGLVEQVEELRFINDRRMLDYDELRKQNYEMQLQLEEDSSLQQQVEELRQICDKLQQQKKQAIFREEVLKVQISNIHTNAETKDIIDRIKIQDMLRKANNTANSVMGSRLGY